MNITRNNKYIPDQSQTLTHSSSHSSLIISSDLDTFSLYKILMNKKKLINETDLKGETFLSYAIKRNKFDNFHLLLTSPILDLKYEDNNGNSYILLATLYQRENMIVPLIEKGININKQNKDGNTALHLAHMLDNKNIIKILINNNIDFTIKNNKGQIAEEVTEKITSPVFINSFGSRELNNKNSKEIKEIVIDSMDKIDIHSSLEKKKDNKKGIKKELYDDDDCVNIGNMNLSLAKKKKINNTLGNMDTKFNTQFNEDNESKIKNIFDDDFFGESIDIPKKVSHDKVEIEKNVKQSNNDFDNKMSIFYRRPSTSDEEEEKKDNKNKDDDQFEIVNNDEEEEYNENYNPLDNNEEDYFKIDNDSYEKNKNNDLLSNRSIKASEIDFNFSISHPEIPKNSNNKNNENKNSKILNSQSFNFNQPNKASAPTANFGINVPIVSKSPLPNQSFSTSSITNINSVSTVQNSLFRFLQKIGMEKYYNNLNSNGFDDISLIIEQTKNNKIGITDKNLKQAGINLPGDRAKILIRIQDLAKNFNFPLPKAIYHVCDDLNQTDSDVHIKKLNNWLNNIKLSEYLLNFISAGYHSIDLLLMQMESKQPLTYDILENEIGIELLGHRQRIMNKLIDDAKSLKNKLKTNTLLVDNRDTNKICNECNIF